MQFGFIMQSNGTCRVQGHDVILNHNWYYDVIFVWPLKRTRASYVCTSRKHISFHTLGATCSWIFTEGVWGEIGFINSAAVKFPWNIRGYKNLLRSSSAQFHNNSCAILLIWFMTAHFLHPVDPVGFSFKDILLFPIDCKLFKWAHFRREDG